MISADAPGLIGNVMLLVTNGGPHPPDKWASVAASFVADLVQIDSKSNSPQAATARKGKPTFIDAMAASFESMFQTAMSDEQTRCDTGVVTHRNDPFQVDSYLPAAVNAAVVASRGSPFTSFFAQPSTQTAVQNLLKQVFIDAVNNQRQFAFDAKGL